VILYIKMEQQLNHVLQEQNAQTSPVAKLPLRSEKLVVGGFQPPDQKEVFATFVAGFPKGILDNKSRFCDPAQNTPKITITKKNNDVCHKRDFKHHRRIMVFDVETTGLLPKRNVETPLEEMPNIIQLSFIIFDTVQFYICKKYNAYIKVSENVEISERITELTGITRQTCDERGIPICDVLDEFYHAYLSCDCIIAHNLSFDKKMVQLEVERNYATMEATHPHILHLFNPTFNEFHNIELYCTMMSSLNICNIMINSKVDPTKQYKKFPKLAELYAKLFHSIPENLHNSLVDTLVCLRCFLKIRLHREIHNVKYNHILSVICKEK